MAMVMVMAMVMAMIDDDDPATYRRIHLEIHDDYW